MIPKTKTNFPRVIVDGEIPRMRDKIENPVRENSQAHDQSGRLSVLVAEPTAKELVADTSHRAPKDRRDQTVRIRMIVRVEHAASREPFYHAELLNPKQDKRRPDVIEKLDGHEQNSERNSVSVVLKCKRDTIMPDKHFRD